MNTINEAELTDFVKNGAIKGLAIIQNTEDAYRIQVSLTWKEGDWTVITTRGNVKEWVSLDNLVRHIKEKYEDTVPPINLILSNKPSRRKRNES